MKQMNILVTCDSGYAKQAALMLYSLQRTQTDYFLNIYAVGVLGEKDLALMEKALDKDRAVIRRVSYDPAMLKSAPVTDRYPIEMYYRIFAAKYLPEDMDRVLYLDPDVTVIRSLAELYEMDLGDAFFAAASHVKEATLLEKVNQARLDMNGIYINSGVLLMNLKALRKEQRMEEIAEYIKEKGAMLFLPDQDIISALYSDRIIPVDPLKYNMTERLYTFGHVKGMQTEWVWRNSCIIHYCGKNKPWKPGYLGKLDAFYLGNLLAWEQAKEEKA